MELELDRLYPWIDRYKMCGDSWEKWKGEKLQTWEYWRVPFLVIAPFPLHNIYSRAQFVGRILHSGINFKKKIDPRKKNSG